MSKIFRVMKGEPVELEHLRYPLLVSPKLNGVRGYVRNGDVLSTSNKLLPNVNLQDKFRTAEHLDGEFIVGDPCDTKRSLNRTTSVVMADGKPIDQLKFYAFDHVKNTDWRFIDRIELLQETKHPGVIIIRHELVQNEKELLAKEIDIAAVNKYLDIARLDKANVPPMARAHYQSLKATGKDCIACGNCEARCPFGVPVIRNMAEAAELLG